MSRLACSSAFSARARSPPAAAMTTARSSPCRPRPRQSTSSTRTEFIDEADQICEEANTTIANLAESTVADPPRSCRGARCRRGELDQIDSLGAERGRGDARRLHRRPRAARRQPRQAAARGRARRHDLPHRASDRGDHDPVGAHTRGRGLRIQGMRPGGRGHDHGHGRRRGGGAGADPASPRPRSSQPRRHPLRSNRTRTRTRARRACARARTPERRHRRHGARRLGRRQSLASPRRRSVAAACSDHAPYSRAY